MKYRAEIDGLRAIAVVPVILFHAGFSLFSGGFVGVDVFFVISGYLITTIIVNELEEGRFSLAKFYERRARRILPALFLVVLVCIPFAWHLFMPIDMRDFFNSVAAVSAFSSNILFWRESGYFEASSELKPLLHTWSLAVEEQYYIFFPLLLMFFWRYRRKTLLYALVFLFFCSLLLSHWGAYNWPNATYFLLPTRGWELLIGSFTAFMLRAKFKPPNLLLNNVMSLLGFLMIGAAVFLFDGKTPYPSLYTLLPTLGTALIILFTTDETYLKKLLSVKLMVGIGLISYSAYLWHQPIFAFARYYSIRNPSFDLSADVFVILVLLTLLLAYLTWVFVEAPFRNRQRISVRQLSYAAASFMLLYFGVGSYVHFNYAEVKSYSLSMQTPVIRKIYDIIDSRRELLQYVEPASAKGHELACRFHAKSFTEKEADKLRACRKRYGGGVVVLGDSHAIDLYGVVTSRFPNPFIVGLSRGDCYPNAPKPNCQYADFYKFVAENPGVVRHVIYEQAGFFMLTAPDEEPGNREMFTSRRMDQPVVNISIDQAAIDQTAAYLDMLSKKAPVTWYGPRVEPHIADRSIIQNGCAFPYKLRKGQYQLFRNLDDAIGSKVRADGDFKFLSQIETMNHDFSRDFISCTKGAYWSDGDHLSALGEVEFGKRLPRDFLEPGRLFVNGSVLVTRGRSVSPLKHE